MKKFDFSKLKSKRVVVPVVALSLVGVVGVGLAVGLSKDKNPSNPVSVVSNNEEDKVKINYEDFSESSETSLEENKEKEEAAKKLEESKDEVKKAEEEKKELEQNLKNETSDAKKEEIKKEIKKAEVKI